MLPGDFLYVGRYLTVGSTQGHSPDPSALLALRVLRVCGGDVVCEALAGVQLAGFLTVSHPGGQQQARAAGGGGGAPAAPAAPPPAAPPAAWGFAGAPPAPAPGEGGGGALGRGGADDSANYRLPIISPRDVGALKVAARPCPARCLPPPARSCARLPQLPRRAPQLVRCAVPGDQSVATLRARAPPQSLAAAFPGTIDFVAVAYVRCAGDVAAARAALEGAGLGASVAAEINTAAALGRRARGRARGRARARARFPRRRAGWPTHALPRKQDLATRNPHRPPPHPGMARSWTSPTRSSSTGN